MRWWQRVLLTLALGPALWWIVSDYVAPEPATFTQWLQTSVERYRVDTLPALFVCAVLLGLDRLLALVSLDLLTVIVSPLAAFAMAWAAVHYVPEPHVRSAGASLPLFAIYGLVWGLTIREPRRSAPAAGPSDGEFVDALLPDRRPGPARAGDERSDAASRA